MRCGCSRCSTSPRWSAPRAGSTTSSSSPPRRPGARWTPRRCRSPAGRVSRGCSGSWSTWACSARTRCRFPADEVYPATRVPPGPHPGRATGKGYVATADDDDEEAALLAALGKDCSLGVPIVVDARVWGALYATRLRRASRGSAGPTSSSPTAVATHVAAGVVQADHFARIERLAFQDPLTGLANRRAVDDRLESRAGARQRPHLPGLRRARRHQPAQAGQRLVRPRGGRPADRRRRPRPSAGPAGWCPAAWRPGSAGTSSASS